MKSKNTFSYFYTALLLLLGLLCYLISYTGMVQEHLNTLDASFVLLYVFTYSFVLLFLLLLIPEIVYRLAKHFKVSVIVNGFEKLFLFYLSVISFLAVLDIKLFAILGNHIYDPFVMQSLGNSEFNKEIHFGLTTWLSIIAFLAIAFFLPRFIFRYISNRNISPKISKIVFVFLCVVTVGGIVFLAFRRDDLLQTEHTFPFLEESGVLRGTYIQIERKKMQGDSSFFDAYKSASENPGIRFARKKDILILMAESFRADMIPGICTPFLSSLADTFSTVKSNHHYSGSHVTEKGLFSVFYGAPTFNFVPFGKAGVKSKYMNALKANGYKLIAVSASPVAHWNGSEFMISQFDEYTEFSEKDPDVNDSLVVQHLWKMQQERVTGDSTPRFIFVFLNSSHHNYYFPASFEMDKPVIEKNYNHFKGDQWLRLQRDKIFNRYKNSVRYIDHSAKRILSLFRKEIDSDNLIFVFTGDHGEEFWDHGFLGHAGSYLYNCRTQVPLIFHLPGNQRTMFDFTSHEELLSSIIHYLSHDQVNRNFYSRRYLDSSEVSNPHILITSASFDDDRKLCLINENGKYWLKINKTGTGVMVRKKLSLDDEELSPVTLDSLVRKQIEELIKSAPEDFRN